MPSRHTLLFALSLAALPTLAQCPFTPTIEPDNLILCPNESATLATQVYDAYQWYKDGNPIAGANGQTLEVEQYADAGSSFTVSATWTGCTESSASVLVDSWVFLLPYLIHGGDEPYAYGPFGEPYFCEGDILTLTLGQPYTENIVWTNNGVPIPGETSPVLTITTPGSYSASGAPGVCPDMISYVGVEVPVTFTPNTQPLIVDGGSGQLCASPVGGATQWYSAGVPVDTGSCISPTTAGPYTVFVDYGQPCQTISEPWIGTGISTPVMDRPVARPNPASGQLAVIWPQGMARGGEWILLDQLGRPAMTGTVPATGPLTLNVRGLAEGHYLLASKGHGWQPLRVVVSH
ncbi:MAG: hypothetical protein KBH07_07755 [Flavobacteriales bacterium]|nr:hypothetical protein [Flavobacteriales bacterium]MBP9078800.1 hypothetical protein [Flavobacteriales bacterium]